MSAQKTTYQGSDRMFGEFKCWKCNRTWSSGNTWANMGQKCLKCDIMIYPYDQRPLMRSSEFDDQYDAGTPHLSHLCEKCKQLGYNCRDRSYY